MEYNADVLSLWDKLALKAIEKYQQKLLVQHIEFTVVKYIAGGYDNEDVNTPASEFRKEFKIRWNMRDNVSFSRMLNISNDFYANPKFKDKTDFAINRKFKIHYAHGLTYGDFDIIDVEPGHYMGGVVYEELAKRYWIVKTKNSYHLYPRTDVEGVDIFGDNGGRAIQDSEWKKGFIRFTESPNKGSLKLLNP